MKVLFDLGFYLLLCLIQLSFYVIPAILFASMLILLPSCAPQPLRLDVICTMQAVSPTATIVNCADQKTWAEK